MTSSNRRSPRNSRRSLLLVTLCLAVLLSGCKKTFTDRPKQSPTLTPTITHTPTITSTSTYVPTVTPTSTPTSTLTLTPYPSLTPTPTATEIIPRPAQLPSYYDTDRRLVDWSYNTVTRIAYSDDGELNTLSALLAFQLQDRAIHRRYLNFQGQDITIYYLNATHEFAGTVYPVGLVLGGAYGKDLPVSLIPAGGSAYVSVHQLGTTQALDAFQIHRAAMESYPRLKLIPGDILLSELESLLPSLPDELIVLAEHPILFPRNDWQQAKLDMTRISALAARYYPLFEFNADERIVDQSDFAYALRDYLMSGAAMPAGIFFYPCQTLVLVSP